MGQAVGPGMGLLGMGIGAMFGGAPGAMIGGAIGSMAGGIIGSFLGNRSHKALITDVQAGNSSYGHPIPILYGTARLAGQMIWQSKITTSGGGIGKGGGTSVFHYHQSAAFLFCEGEAILAKIWLDGVLFWDATNPTQEFTKHTFLIREHTGSETELPDPLIATWVSQNVDVPQACPAYRGIAYLVCEGVDLINYGNRFPQVTAAWTANGTRGVFVQPLTVSSTDVTQPSFTGAFEWDAQADWLSGMTYTVSNVDGTVRAFSMATGTEVASIIAADYDPSGAAPASAFGTGLAVAQSAQRVYVYNGITASIGYYIRALDRNTLRPLAAALTMPADPDAFVLFPSGITDLVARQITGQDGGVGECLIGVGGFGDVFLCQVLADGSIEPPAWMKVHFGNVATYTTIASGDDDVADDGRLRIYALNSSFFGDGLYLYRFITDGSSIAEPTLLGVLMPSTFGYTDGAAGANSFFDCSGWFDAADGTLIVALRCDGTLPGDFIAKIDPNKLLAGQNPVIWQTTAAYATQAGDVSLMQATRLQGGTLAFGYAGTFSILDLATGTVTSETDPNAATDGLAGAVVSYAYDGTRNALLVSGSSGTGVHLVYLDHVTTGPMAVGAIIADLCARVGMTPAMIDVSAVTATTQGYVVPDVKTAGAAILDLCHTYQIDIVESDYTLKFVPRGRAPIATIAQSDLVSTDPADPSKFWLATAAQEQEMPLLIVLKYADPALDYQPGSAYASRSALPVPTMWAKRRMVIDLPVIATNDEARHIAETWLYTVWAERVTYQTALSQRYLWLDPTDNVTVTFADGAVNTVRIEEMQLGADLTLKLKLAAEDAATYVASASPGASYSVGQQTISLPVAAQLLSFNVPLLRDQDAAPVAGGRVYFAAGSNAPQSFIGASVYHSQDGINWPLAGQLAGAANWGRTIGALGDTANPFATDPVNAVTVSLLHGANLPSSCGYTALMNGANAALIGAEVIQFQTVTDNPDGTYTFSTLLRGRRGTDWATARHTAGELVILLDPTTVSGGVLTLSEINQSESWKLVQPGDALSDVTTQEFIYRGFDLKPYAPVNVVGQYAGSDIALNWTRRTRLGGLLVDGTDVVPLGETTEAYDLEILDASAAAVLRTYAGLTAPAATYPAAAITSDWGSPPARLWVRVYQISSVVGRGFSRHWQLDLASGLAIADAGDTP